MMVSRTSLVRCLLAGSMALLAVPAPATAQWLWKDAAGQIVASDQPPPIGTPQSRIIKEPRARPAPSLPVAGDKDTGSKEASKEAAKTDAPKSLADRDLESRQKQKEAAEAAKKADEEATKARAMQENCNSVRGNLAALQAGGRAARFNAAGERIYLDDAQRQAEITKSQGQISQFCK